MIMQIVKFHSALSLEEVQKIAEERAAEFKNVPGLIQKYYFRSQEEGQYGGVYIWDSLQSLAAYRDSELAASIPQAYKLSGPPNVEIHEVAFMLRD
jgi:heme-degrading monooxygenase HmoA